MNVDGRKLKVAVEQKGTRGQFVELLYTGRQTRSARPEVFYELADYSSDYRRTSSKTLSKTEKSAFEKEQLLAASTPLPLSSWDTSSSSAENTPLRRASTPTSNNRSVPILSFEESVINNMPGQDEQPATVHTNISGDGALLPQPFHGRPQEDAELWLDYFLRYCTYKGMNGEQQLALVKVLFRDTACDWLTALPDDQKSSLEALKTAFNNRFRTNDAVKYRSARELFTTKQKEKQSVDEYVTEMIKIALKVGQKRDDDITRHAVLSGLRPRIASQILMTNPKTVHEVITRARLAELADSPEDTDVSSNGGANMADDLRNLQVRQLCDEVHD